MNTLQLYKAIILLADRLDPDKIKALKEKVEKAEGVSEQMKQEVKAAQDIIASSKVAKQLAIEEQSKLKHLQDYKDSLDKREEFLKNKEANLAAQALDMATQKRTNEQYFAELKAIEAGFVQREQTVRDKEAISNQRSNALDKRDAELKARQDAHRKFLESVS